ncbi:hypothetical protein PGQ11_009806 [Apiospora arundinis]|uniref:Uncharacterized protein n=1 Tax=Apiospora arundinis TaxID=335852 RepID=A0ABR2I8D5_9PEZI
MSRTSLELNTCHATNTAPWLFSDPYAYQYADIPNHIRQISSTARQGLHSTTKDGQQLSVTTAVEAGSVPIFEMEGCMPTTPRVNVVGADNAEVASGLRFELEDSSSRDGSDLANGLARLTITPSVTAQCSLSSSLTPGCLQIGGGSGIKSPSTPTTPSASTGLLRRSTATRAPSGGSRRASRVVTTAPPPAAIAEAHNRLETPPPPYAPATISPQERLSYQHHQQQAPLSALSPHLRHHKRQSYSVSLSASVPISPCATPTTPTSPASDLDSILRNIKEDRRRARDSVLIMEAEESRRGSRGSRAYAKYCDNN